MHAISRAPVNIALVKYWGKSDDFTNMAANDSFSVTLRTINDSVFRLETETRVEFNGANDTFIMGTCELPIGHRMDKCISYLREKISFPPIKITSNNLFPSSAGMASSASGMAALVKAIAGLVSATTETCFSTEDLVVAARIGSGSACRSIFDGFVHWDHKSGLSSQYRDSQHWPDLRCIVLVFDASVKKVPSTLGMLKSMNNSDLIKNRISEIVPRRVKEMMAAVNERDFPVLGKLIMQESNQLHAICMDTYPPMFYLSEASRCIIEAVHRINNEFQNITAAYTFDAGPNPFVFCLACDLDKILPRLEQSLRARELVIKSTILCEVGTGATVTIIDGE